MIKLSPLRSEKVWGYEDWIASVHPDLPQNEFLNIAKDYPLLVKIIQANDTLSIQVHPDDETAAQLEGAGSVGKTECWYILDAKPDAKLVCGLNKHYTIQEIKKAINDNTLESMLNQIPVKKGDFIFIPSGTVHAIGGDLRLLEVQQNCNITYRMYDWGRPRELHIEKSLKSIKQQESEAAAPKNTTLSDSFECPYFEIIKKEVSGGYSFFNSSQKVELLFVSQGKNLSSTFTMPDGNRTENMYLYEEQIFAILPKEKVTIEGKGQIIRIKSK